jgi:hypothetical protein
MAISIPIAEKDANCRRPSASWDPWLLQQKMSVDQTDMDASLCWHDGYVVESGRYGCGSDR